MFYFYLFSTVSIVLNAMLQMECFIPIRFVLYLMKRMVSAS